MNRYANIERTDDERTAQRLEDEARDFRRASDPDAAVSPTIRHQTHEIPNYCPACGSWIHRGMAACVFRAGCDECAPIVQAEAERYEERERATVENNAAFQALLDRWHENGPDKVRDE